MNRHSLKKDDFRVLSCVVALLLVAVLAGHAQTPNATLTSWELPVTASGAAISPDDKLLAVTVKVPITTGGRRRHYSESVEVWDYQKGEKLAEAQLATYQTADLHSTVHFTADGSLLVAADPAKLHLLDPVTLKEVRLIEPPLPAGFRIMGAGMSPTGHIAIVPAGDWGTHSVLYVYDLDSSRLLFQWTAPLNIGSVSWNEDGTQFAVATPFPCTSFSDTIHIFSTSPWKYLRGLKARNPGSIAFSPDRLYVVEAGFCESFWHHRHLGLESFDVRDWHRQKTLFLPHRDIHDVVSFARGRLLADTSELKTTRDWLDGTAMAIATDVEFTVWKSDGVELTSQRPPTSRDRQWPGIPMRLSRSGKMVLMNFKHPQVFELP